jgi:hypothetical protein
MFARKNLPKLFMFRSWRKAGSSPHCGSEKVEQQVAAFSAVTSKKS